MADEDEKKDPGDVKQENDNEPKPTKAGIGILVWAILAVIVVLCAASGFLLGRLFAEPDKAQTQSPQTDKADQPESTKMEDLTSDSKNNWYYPLDPVVANLDVPGVTRYVRVTVILQISSALHREKAEKLLEDKKPILTNWLTIYLASLTLEDIRGDRNLKRIQSQILDAFNEKLFPDAKPQIKQILFKEFAIQ
jgi:flagellar basal body-associated protein FliL